jgi:Mg/Co/Ni transporter MgtE
MDPSITTAVDEWSVGDALAQIRQSRDETLFNLYVTDRDGILVGTVNLHELLTAGTRTRLSAIMHQPVMKLLATADRHQIIAHPGWRRVSSLPVVDDRGLLLGALRYQTLRRIETEIDRVRGAPGISTTAALGELFVAGLGGIVDALAVTMTRSDSPRRIPGADS